MKRILIVALSVLALVALIAGGSPVMAAKPPSVIPVSNGFPSGMHFNLNIHGKDPTTFTTPGPPPYDPATYGNCIFIPEYTELYEPITIQCVSNKSGGTEFVVTDPYAMPSEYRDDGPTGFAYADDLAQFNLPYKIQTDTGVINANGYYVYGRILGKPDNSKTDGASSSIIVTPSPIIQYDTDGAELPLGMITTQGSYKADDSGYFYRFDDSSPFNGKGKSVARNITDMFMWTGWVYDASLDINKDGVIDINDIPLGDYDSNPSTPDDRDYNNNGVVDQADFESWRNDMEAAGLARYYEDWWVFDLAELVVQSWGIDNDGTKLLQIRFYPVATTTFTEKAHIVVQKAVTDSWGNPITDTTTLFSFEASYRNPWQMTSNQFCLSLGLTAGSYSVTELTPPEWWALTGIAIIDPTSGSSYDLGEATAYIDLAVGETVIVTFTNAYTAP